MRVGVGLASLGLVVVAVSCGGQSDSEGSADDSESGAGGTSVSGGTSSSGGTATGGLGGAAGTSTGGSSKGGSAGTSTGGSAGMATGGGAGAGTGGNAQNCDDLRRGILTFIESNKTCFETSECIVHLVGCGISEDGCTGAVYTNDNASRPIMESVRRELASCVSIYEESDVCIVCDRVPLPPTCSEGRCIGAATRASRL